MSIIPDRPPTYIPPPPPPWFVFTQDTEFGLRRRAVRVAHVQSVAEEDGSCRVRMFDGESYRTIETFLELFGPPPGTVYVAKPDPDA